MVIQNDCTTFANNLVHNMAGKTKRIELRVDEDFYNRVNHWKKKWGWTMTVAVSYMLSEQMNFLENHRYKNSTQSPSVYSDTKNPDKEDYDQTPKELTAAGKLIAQMNAQKKHGSKL